MLGLLKVGITELIYYVWPYVVSMFGLIAMELVGRRKKIGYIFGIIGQTLLIAYGIITAEHGFILGAVGFNYIYLRHWIKWRRIDKQNVQLEMASGAMGSATDC